MPNTYNGLTKDSHILHTRNIQKHASDIDFSVCVCVGGAWGQKPYLSYHSNKRYYNSIKGEVLSVERVNNRGVLLLIKIIVYKLLKLKFFFTEGSVCVLKYIIQVKRQKISVTSIQRVQFNHL